jgi:hypothetical protein
VSDWQKERAEECAELTETATKLLVGATVRYAEVVPHDAGCDGVNVLRLTLADGRTVLIEGGYGGYSGYSCDEYYEYISIKQEAAA